MKDRRTSRDARHTAKWIRGRIEKGGERVWRFEDFAGAPVHAVAQTLSRLARHGRLQRLSKGVYYSARPTAFGKSAPNPAAIRKLATRGRKVFPAGIAAANRLGFTTQSASRGEVATTGFRLPRKLLGSETIVHTRRPEAWAGLPEEDAALLDFLRRGGRTSELSAEETVERLISLLRRDRRFERLLRIADSEPPRVRAMLGALGEALRKKPRALERLRGSLNPLSRFDFGVLGILPGARRWQAKDGRSR